jgi:hypothetical protein
MIDKCLLLLHNRCITSLDNHSMSSQTLQVKLSLDAGLKHVWEQLLVEYEGLDKAGIIRLALNSLVKTLPQKRYTNMTEVMDELDKVNDKNMTEEEFADFWNKTKHSV